MIRNQLKVALRYLLRHRGYTLINLSGLAVGIACALLIMLFVRSEWSFDGFHQKRNRIYRAWLEEHYKGEVFKNTATPIPLGPVVKANLPEVEDYCRVGSVTILVKSRGTQFSELLNTVDPSLFTMFDIDMKEGSKHNPFPTANSIIISEKAAKKYFGSVPAVGQTLVVQLSDTVLPMTVSGVTSTVPVESSIQFEMLISYEWADIFWSKRAQTDGWMQVYLETYFLLKDGAQLPAVTAKTAALLDKKVAGQYKPGEYLVHYQPLADIHLNNALPAGNQPTSDPAYAYILATIGVLILLIACINFITLSIGRSTTRGVEVGVRKVLGAGEAQLMGQYWSEAVLVTLAALVLGVGLALILVKPFSLLANRELSFSLDGFTLLFCLGMALVVATASGLYAAFVLSRFAPIQALKGKLTRRGGMDLLRKGLVVGQFAASIVMIIGTFVVGKQLDYLHTKDLGYHKEQTLIVQTDKPGKEGRELGKRFRELLDNEPRVLSSTSSLFSMAEPGWISLGYEDDKNVYRTFQANLVDENFVPAMGLKLLYGRNFDQANPGDRTVAIIVNEALVREYGWKDPIGQKLPGKYPHRVIGVVKDFHYESLYTKIQPLVLAMTADSLMNNSSNATFPASPRTRITVQLAKGDLPTQVEAVRRVWKQAAGDQDFSFKFLDEAVNAEYAQAERLGKMVRLASGLSIFIACLGLFGLATLVVARRTKEIGIRKVLGADVGRIVALISKDFVVLVGLAALIAFPMAWWALKKWLSDFIYRIDIPWWVFLAAAFAALLVALATVSIQAIRAAVANPVNSLRTE